MRSEGYCQCTPPSTLRTLGGKSLTGSGKERAGLLKELEDEEYDDTEIVKFGVSDFLHGELEACKMLL